jgi:hypothetical protein
MTEDKKEPELELAGAAPSRSQAKNYPFYECVEAADKLIQRGALVYQKFTCSNCGVRQTMPDANVFYKKGLCEECKSVTDIEHDGCNYLVLFMGIIGDIKGPKP